MPRHQDIIDKKSAESDAISDQVAEFLAKGGEVQQMENCTAADAIDRYRKPYSIHCKDGTQRMYRPVKNRFDLNKLVPKTFNGFNSK
jgi:hypothetical protein